MLVQSQGSYTSQIAQAAAQAPQNVSTSTSDGLIGLTVFPLFGTVPAVMGVGYTLARLAYRTGEIGLVAVQQLMESDPAKSQALTTRQIINLADYEELFCIHLRFFAMRAVTLCLLPG